MRKKIKRGVEVERIKEKNSLICHIEVKRQR